MDIPQQSDEIPHVVNRLTLETVLEKMAGTFVFQIEILRIGNGNALDGWHQPLIEFAKQQVDMIRHEAIGVDDAMRRQRMPLLVFRMSLKSEQLSELPIIRPLLKDILMIDTPQHNVVDARTTLFSCFSWHNFFE